MAMLMERGATAAEYPALARVRTELEAFKRKFYLNLLVRGGLVAGGLLLTFFVVFNGLEYFLYLPTVVRAGLLFGFIGLTIYSFARWIWTPLAALTNLRRLLSDEQAARRVGEIFPEVQDRLLNALQLQGQARDNALIAASLEQRAAQFGQYSFAEGINIQQQSKPLWKYAAIPAAAVLALLAFYPSFLVQGTERIWHYKRAYSPPAPFQFLIKNTKLTAFRGEDFTLDVGVAGAALPAEVSIAFEDGERRLSKVTGHGDQFRYTFEQPQGDVAFQLKGAGFASPEYQLTVLERPNLRDFKVSIAYPPYTGRPAETVENGGNLTVPEGSTVRWEFATAATDELALVFQNPDETLAATGDDGTFTAERRIMRSQPYLLRLKNPASLNRDPISYQLTAVLDLPPSLTLEVFSDTVTRRFLALGGTVRDDYGLTRLELHYALRRTGQGPNSAPSRQGATPLGLPRESAGTYAYTWNLSALNMQPGDRLEYFVEAWDNDGVHGPKATRTRPVEFRLPSRRELRQELNAQAQSVASQMSQAAKQSEKLERELAKTQDKLKTKRDLSFQDRKQLENMLDQKNQMNQQMEQMQKMFEQLQQKQDQLSPKSEELAKKAEELKKLMADLLDPETKKLYEKLRKLLEEQKTPDAEMQKLLQQLENKEDTLQKELDRALEMFKQMQLEQKAEETANKLEELAKQEEQLAEKTAQNDKENPDNKASNQDQKAKQEQLKQEQAENQKEFEDLKKELQDLKQMDKELGDQNGMDEQKPEQEQTDQDMQESQQSLSKNQNKKAAGQQKSAAARMKKMAQKMRDQMSEEETDQAQQNIDDLRNILDNLLTLSFDQEQLMKDFRKVDQSDPRFVQLGQTQRKLRDDAKIIQDSLYALAKKEPKIQSFVTREVGEMNGRMDESLTHIQQRDLSRATATEQQAMTSMNNLALMLQSSLDQMQQEAQAGKGAPKDGQGKPGKKKGKGKGQGPGGKPGPGNMGKMQQQLNEQIQQLSKSGKSGREMSQELAKLAGQQQMLRQAMQQLDKLQQGGKPGGSQGQGGGQPGQGQPKDGKDGKDGKEGGKDGKDGKGDQGAGGTGDIKKMMEQTETDLVNKRLTEETMMRQQQILTRLLEVEKSARERDQDTKREAQAAQTKPPVFPPAFDKYRVSKERQTELLRSTPPNLTPYYQREVGEYFQKIK
ncbi:ATPase [Hymenobacter glaciei]|uniref:ATPase n=1 Tax=Hymenobacter glaciei TaxID=877209 RepID=A0ABP7U9B4_9BACT